MSLDDFFKPKGSEKVKPKKEPTEAKPAPSKKSLSTLIGKIKVSTEGGYTQYSEKKTLDLESRVKSRAKLDRLKKNTVLKTSKKKVAGISAEVLESEIYQIPVWMQDRYKHYRLEIYFKVNKDRLVDTYSLKVYMLPSAAWYDKSTIRIDLKYFDPEAFTAIAANITAASYTATAWSRLTAGAEWYIVYRFTTKTVTGHPDNTEFNLVVRMDGLRFKNPDENWTWITNDDTVNVKHNKSGGMVKNGKVPRQILIMMRLLPGALHKLKSLPRLLIQPTTVDALAKPKVRIKRNTDE
jgi:hypothetical protein